MANWKLYMLDRAAGRIASTQVSASSNATMAAYLVDSNQSTRWTPGTGGTDFYIYFDLGASYSITGIGIGGHNLEGETVIAYSASAFTTGVLTERATKTLGATDEVITWTAASSQYWRLRISSTITANQGMATVSWLANEYAVEFDYPSAPRYPIGGDYQHGHAVSLSRGGHEFRQTLGGVSVLRQLVFDVTSLSSGGSGATVLEHYLELAGCPTGVWMTDDTFASNQGRGYYGLLDTVSAPIAYPGARGPLSFVLREHPKAVEA